MIVISHFQACQLLAYEDHAQGSISISLDLEVTQTNVDLSSDGISNNGIFINWQTLREICENEIACFLIEGDQVSKIQTYSEEFNRFYSLMPTRKSPTLLISGIPMHRIKGIDPYEDTRRKIKAIRPVRGRVLDTATGLGYTAITAARTAVSVDTIELDPVVIEICRLNPWSQELFSNPKIAQHIGDAFDIVETFDNESFSVVLHDPPTFSLAGHLYSFDFYHELLRVLNRQGRLFHYIGDPKSKSGAGITKGVVKRLKQAGFRDVKFAPRAFGVVAHK